MKKLLFLYNTHAGKGLLKSRLAAVQDALAAAGWDVTIHPTQGAGDATAVAAARAGEFDRIVCSGGDGTLHEVVAGLMGLENRPEVGYIPAGTTNDFAKNLSLPRGMEAMARVAAAGVPRPVDIGSFNDRYFIYVAAFGAFTDVAYSTPQPVKNIFGHLAYVLEGATRLGSIQAYPLTVEHDGGVEEGGFCYGMVSNTVSVGGFKGMPAEPVRLDDGLFEVVLVRQPQNPLQLQAVIKALLTMSPDEGGLVTSFRTSRLRVACGQELPWTLDGEFGGAPAVAEIVNRQKAVNGIDTSNVVLDFIDLVGVVELIGSELQTEVEEVLLQLTELCRQLLSRQFSDLRCLHHASPPFFSRATNLVLQGSLWLAKFLGFISAAGNGC